ncbi:MAG: hypothetical protein M0Z73_07540 [Betaproteobacteria bacterium]|nr:hypothetical protein [Betaproteobacteria bacterium]
MRPTFKPAAAKRLRVDLRRMRHGTGYLIALGVVGAVLYLAWHVSRGQQAPDWWTTYAVPAIYWSSPFLIAIAIAVRVREMRRRHREPKP